jgi:hypothetical protein
VGPVVVHDTHIGVSESAIHLWRNHHFGTARRNASPAAGS